MILVKRYFLFLLLLTSSFACSDDEFVDNTSLIGTWELIEQYADPGDGSGDYEPIESDRTITFNEDSTFDSNGTMCSMTGETTASASGDFSEADGTLSPQGCSFSGFGITFELLDGYLYLYYPCIEGCGQKFEKVN